MVRMRSIRFIDSIILKPININIIEYPYSFRDYDKKLHDYSLKNILTFNKSIKKD